MREILFQRVWHNCLFNHDKLVTTCGKSVQIISGGDLNHADGPDFSNARIRMNDLAHFGSVELHIHCSDWYAHGHHLDPKYNNVILHVVLYPDNACPVQLEDGTSAPTLILQTDLHAQWQTSLFRARHRETIPCAAFSDRLNPDALKTQLQTAALEYFEEKRRELLNHYEVGLPPSAAFLKMLFIGWCEGLGIPNNRDPMKDLSTKLWSVVAGSYGKWPALKSEVARQSKTDDSFRRNAAMQNLFLEIAGLLPKDDCHIGRRLLLDSYQSIRFDADVIAPEPMRRTIWNFKGTRGYNHPIMRVKQAANTFQFLSDHGIRHFLHSHPDEIAAALSSVEYSGGERGDVLCRTVLLPALDILAELFHKPRLHDQILRRWFEIPVTVPKTVKSAFSANEIFVRTTENHPGSLHQYREYCSKHRCAGCNVFKNIIGG